jgi:hypothetical protein
MNFLQKVKRIKELEDIESNLDYKIADINASKVIANNIEKVELEAEKNSLLSMIKRHREERYKLYSKVVHMERRDDLIKFTECGDILIINYSHDKKNLTTKEFYERIDYSHKFLNHIYKGKCTKAFVDMSRCTITMKTFKVLNDPEIKKADERFIKTAWVADMMSFMAKSALTVFNALMPDSTKARFDSNKKKEAMEWLKEGEE